MISILLNYYNFDENWARQIGKYLDENTTVAVMPFAYRDYEVFDNTSWQQLYGKNGEKYQTIVSPLKHYGVLEDNIVFVNYFDTEQSHCEITKSADVLLFTGGLPDKILDRLNALNLTQIVATHPCIIGVSAGAMFQLKQYHITPDDDYTDYISSINGIDRVRGLDLEVHFENTNTQLLCIKQAICDNNLPIYAIWHQGGVIVDNGNITVIGKVDKFGI